MTLILDRYPLEYRSEIVQPVLTAVAGGSSVCIAGLAGVGKSNLTKFLAQSAVLGHYLPQSIAQEMHVLVVHCRPGTQASSSFYAAMLNELQTVAETVRYSLPIPQQTVTAYDVRKAIKHLCEQARQRIVFVLDEFECLIQHQPLEFFEELRNLRDEVRTTNRFAYVTITHRLPHRVQGNQRFENSKLFDLLRSNIYALGPYSPPDALGMLNALAAAQDMTVERDYLLRIGEAAGGHSGIMRAVFETIRTECKGNFAVPSPRLKHFAVEHRTVRDASDYLWLHLHSSERRALRQLAAGQLPEPWLLDFLYKRGLITNTETPNFFAPVFGAYMRSKIG